MSRVGVAGLVRSLALGASAGVGLVAGATPARAQQYSLEIRPRPGDTLRLHLEQTVEMSATSRVGPRDSTITTATSMHVFARVIAQSADARGTLLLAITDSVRVSTSGTTIPPALEESRRALYGARIQMRVHPNGSSQIISDPSGIATALQAFVGQMPATLPDRPIAIGETWTRAMPVPLDSRPALGRTASVRTTFRLDSVPAPAHTAFITLRGELKHDAASPIAGIAAEAPVSGVIAGSMQMDRRRGWLTDSRASITLRTTVANVVGRGDPMTVLLTITQRMRVLDKR